MTRSRWRLLLWIIAASVLTGCAEDVALVNPRTGAATTCRADLRGLDPWSQQEACIGEHVAEGWVRAGTE